MFSISKEFARTSLKAMVLIAFSFCLTSFVTQLYYRPEALLDASPDEDFIAWFLQAKMGVDQELSIPAWFTSSLLLVCSMLLALIAYSTRQIRGHYALHWGVLSASFILLSLDESVMLHEHTPEVLGFLPTLLGSTLAYDWVFIGIPLVLVFMLAYAKFLFKLSVQLRRLFIAAGALYITGAVGMEIVGAFVALYYSWGSVPYIAAITIEEFLEMIGIILFLYALMLRGCANIALLGDGNSTTV
jgi:hypothetical protein